MGMMAILTLALCFFLILGGIILNLVIFNSHVDVQQAPYDTIGHKKMINSTAMLDIICPFVIAFLMLIGGQFLGVLLLAPYMYMSINRIVKKQIYMDATTNYKRIKEEEIMSIVKVINMFVEWVYTLIKFILTLVRD